MIPIYGAPADDYYDLVDGKATKLAIKIMDVLIRETQSRAK